MHLSLEKKAGYEIPIMTYYPHNGWLKDPGNKNQHKKIKKC